MGFSSVADYQLHITNPVGHWQLCHFHTFRVYLLVWSPRGYGEVQQRRTRRLRMWLGVSAAIVFVTRSEPNPPRGTRTQQLSSLSKHLRKPTTSGSDLGCSAKV